MNWVIAYFIVGIIFAAFCLSRYQIVDWTWWQVFIAICVWPIVFL